MSTIQVGVAPGELIDKITILQIKSEKITDPAKLENVRYELDLLSTTRDVAIEQSQEIQDLTAALKDVNLKLWQIEDDIRDCERAKDFSDTFIQLARAVYITNDERARLKRAINDALGSKIVEEKSYADYS